ncbi:hypothetical protein OH492_07395 [Vibrio chagasii]|nr:hypothetical protein [Vibrio chagasii]
MGGVSYQIDYAGGYMFEATNPGWKHRHSGIYAEAAAPPPPDNRNGWAVTPSIGPTVNSEQPLVWV